jgi:response regulator RpfG family c-di-GMP phosphodiesterase
MEKQVLIVDPDPQIFRHALAILPYAGCRVIAEHSANKAMAIAQDCPPHVIIAPVHILERWARGLPGKLEEIQATSSLLVTADRADKSGRWRRWAMSGCEVLLKPVVHPWQLYTAVELAIGKIPFVWGRDLRAEQPLAQVLAQPSTSVQAA